MKGYPHLAAKLFASPLMLHPPVRHNFARQLISFMEAGGVAHVQPSPQAESDRERRQQRRVNNVYEKIGSVALIRFHGVVDKRISDFDMDCYGGLDLDDVDAALSRAGSDPGVSRVVLDFHSPGGSVTGTPETAARVAALREKKEVHAFISTLCCSAAYFVASQADKITAAPSATVGSIGVYTFILDETAALEAEGIKVEFIKAGKFKGIGASFKPLTDEERAMLQGEVDRIWKDFKTACTTLRDIDEDDMQGQWFDGTSAKARKLVDETTNQTLDEYVSGLLMQ
jgi:signal peptide peptidase SppA